MTPTITTRFEPRCPECDERQSACRCRRAPASRGDGFDDSARVPALAVPELTAGAVPVRGRRSLNSNAQLAWL